MAIAKSQINLMRWTFWLLPAALAVALAGCAALGGETPAADEAAIVGGRLESPGSVVARQTVALLWQGSFLCTASLLDDAHALTARHCTRTPTGDPPPAAEFDLVFGVDVQASVPRRPVVTVTQKLGVGEDLAILGFSGGLPSAYRPVTLAQGTRIQKGTPVLHAGYGVTGAALSDNGILRSVEGLVSNPQPVPGFHHYYTQKSGKTVCYGDSGGPDFAWVRGQLRQLGVHSSTSGPPVCTAFAVTMDVRAYLDWIRSTGVRPQLDTEPVDADLTASPVD